MNGICTNVRASVYTKFASSASPGPAQYDSAKVGAIGRQTLSVRTTAPKYSFGSSKRRNGRSNTTPAANRYKTEVSAFGRQPVSRRRSSSCATFGRARRNGGKSGYTTPGPNAYNSGGTFGSRPHSASSSRLRRSPSFSFGSGRRSTETRATTPGPGNYKARPSSVGRQVISTKPSAQGVKFGTSKRSGRATTTTPGPNAYHVVVDGVKKKAPGIKFGTAAPRTNLGKSSTPAPNAYDVGGTIGRKASNSRMPGAPATKFGTSPRAPEKRDATPGPNAYDPHRDGEAQRMGARAKSASSLKPNAPAFSFGTATSSSALGAGAGVPGPGQYNSTTSLGRQVVSAKPTAGGVKFGTSKRKGMVGSDAPGPGQYNTSHDAHSSRHERAPTFAFGTSPRSIKYGDDTPGPNQYDVTAAGASYRHRAGYKFGTSSRDDLVRKDKTPGPQYHTEVSSIGKQTMSRHKSSGSFKFTTSPRFVKKTVVTPAPDAYNTVAHMEASSRKKHAPAFTIGAR